MNWNFLPAAALLVLSGIFAVRRALSASEHAPETPCQPIASARTSGERAWREQPVQTFMWQLQAARYSQPPFRRP